MTVTSVRPADSKLAIAGPRRGELVRAHRALQARGGQVKVDLDTAQGPQSLKSEPWHSTTFAYLDGASTFLSVRVGEDAPPANT
jgi:hypothetical protein